MTILFLDQFSELGGAQLCLLDLIPAIHAKGWHARAALPGEGPLAGRLRALGIPVDRVRCENYASGRKSIFDFARFARDVLLQARTISRLINEHSIGLVYVNGPRLMPAAARATGGRTPLLFHAHIPIQQESAVGLVGRAIRSSQATVVGCCDFVARQFEPFAGQRLRVVLNGVAELPFRERDFRFPSGPRIGIIGRIAPEKGHDVLLRAAPVILQAVPNARFVVYGAPLFSDPAFYESVRSLATRLPVEFHGWSDDVQSALAQLDLLVVPSSVEGLPRVVLEAFAAGVPVVAFPAGGIPEAVEDRVTAFLTASTHEALAERVCDLLNGDPSRLQAIAARARAEWERRFNVERYRNEMAGILVELIGSRTH